jgi:hypothetical protein
MKSTSETSNAKRRDLSATSSGGTKIPAQFLLLRNWMTAGYLFMPLLSRPATLEFVWSDPTRRFSSNDACERPVARCNPMIKMTPQLKSVIANSTVGNTPRYLNPYANKITAAEKRNKASQ